MIDAQSIFFNHHFFVITSDNCTNHTSRLYGYAIFDSKIHVEGSVENIPFDADGVYINVVRKNNQILIQQDYNGSYGLYIFNEDGFFAISNSFFKLLEYLKDNKKLSINKDYARYFSVDPLSSISTQETLIQEIKILPKEVEVNIDLLSKEISINNIKNILQKYSLFSKEGIKILDDWYHKWQGLLIGLQNDNQHISVDLTGGMDSRATFSIFNNNKIDMSKIRVNSSTGKFHTHPEDFEIASIISQKMGFQLNKILDIDRASISSTTAIRLSFLAKFGIHKQMFFRKYINKQKLFSFTGSGGEAIRGHWNKMTLEHFINEQYKYHKYSTLDFSSSIHKIVTDSIQDITDRYGFLTHDDMMRNLYTETRLRTHFGRSNVENFLYGSIFLNPLADRELQRIHNGSDDLLCVIYDRYLPQLKEIRFDNNKSLQKSSLEQAKLINTKFPYKKPKKLTPYKLIESKSITPPNFEEDGTTPLAKLRESFDLRDTQEISNHLFGNELYVRAKFDWDKGGHFPERLGNFLVGMALINRYINEPNLFKHQHSNPLLSGNSDLILSILDFFKTARIDIKNFGDNANSITIKHNTKNCEISQPAWFAKNGTGYIIQSNTLKFEAVLDIVNDGQLQFGFRGVDSKALNGEKVQAWIDFCSFRVDGIEQLTEPVAVWHDKSYHWSKPVKNGDSIHISIEWLPHSFSRSDFIQLANDLFDSLPFKSKKM